MSTVVCQGLQSCPEPQPVESKTLRLKLAFPNASFFESIGLAGEKSGGGGGGGGGGWSCLQALYTTTSQSPQEALDKESSYVHPMMMKRSSSMLTDKSLELCTENLGSETGTDTIESNIFSLSSAGDQTPTREQPKSRRVVVNNSRNFPSPLTTISGSSSLQVKPHREGGRLIIKAVEAPSPHTYLQAERSHGRLRLSIWKDCSSTNEDTDMEELENEAYEEEEEEEEDEEEEEEEEDREDMDGNSLDVGVEMGMEKFPRRSRCNESGPGNDSLCNWEAFWVATS